MRRRRGKTHLLALIALTLIVTGGAILFYQRQGRRSGQRFEKTRLFPNLNVDRIAAVEITTPEEVIELRSQGEAWGLASRAGFPVDAERLRRLVLRVAGLEAIDQMTQNPDKYDQLGVGEEPKSALIRFRDDAGTELAILHVGNEREGRPATPGGFAPTEGQYVRKSGDAWVYKIAEALTVEGGATTWLSRDILKVEDIGLQRVMVDHGETTDTLTLTRVGEDPFELVGEPPAGYRVKSWMASTVARALASLTLTDVIPADDPKVAEIDFDTTYTAIQKNGLAYVVSAGRIGEDRYLRIGARYDERQDLSLSDERTSDTVAARGLELPDVTMKRIAERHGRWVYQVASYQHDNLTKKFSDFLEEEPPAPPPTSPDEAPAGESQGEEEGIEAEVITPEPQASAPADPPPWLEAGLAERAPPPGGRVRL